MCGKIARTNAHIPSFSPLQRDEEYPSLTKLKNYRTQLIKHETKYHYLVISIELTKISILVKDIDEKEIDKFKIEIS